MNKFRLRLRLKNKQWIVLLILLFPFSVFATDITGAGASFPAPIYAKWADLYYKESGYRVNYQSIGSSAGIKQILEKTVDFGATDAPLSDAELDKYGLVQFPTVVGSIVPIINIPSIQARQLKLTGMILADIYLGKITYWDDTEIKTINPNISLPHEQIIVVHRADGSGTSFVFTSYLSKVNETWKVKVGSGVAVKWPVGVGGKGNEGVAAYVTRLKNSIGYVEYAYAKQNKLADVVLQNAAGNFVQPNVNSITAAINGVDWAKTYVQDMTNAAGEQSWPLSTATYILLPKDSINTEQRRAVIAFFDWAFKKGDAAALELDYVPLTESVKKLIQQSWQQANSTTKG